MSTLDPQMRAVLEMAASSGAPDLCDLPPQASRGLYSQIMAATALPVAEVDIAERTIEMAASALTLRVYTPRTPRADRGVLLYLHGGGFVVGCPRDYDSVCSHLALQADCVVVQVDYRLAPEHPFPAAIDDAYATLVWLAANAAQFGVDANRIAIGGDSAGANLATVVCLLARDRQGPVPALQTLIYPVTALLPESFDSYRRFGSGFTLTTRATWHFTELYLGTRTPQADFRAAPLLAQDLGGLPPTLLLVAGLDVLRDEGVAYGERLIAAGNQVTLVEYSGLVHGFIGMGGAVMAARLALEQVAGALRLAFAASPAAGGAVAGTV